MKDVLQRTLLRPLGILGVPLALGGLIGSVGTLTFELFETRVDPYRGIFAYLVFPPLMFLGFGLLGLAVLRERRRSAKARDSGGEIHPLLDLRSARHRRIIAWMLGVLSLFVAASLVGGFQAFHFTESVEFCGQTCHAPMNPQYVAYQDSPHAQIPCVECHVGPGVGDYAKAKLAGLRQVYKVLTGSLDLPVHAAREDILPADTTCEHCHWPEKDWGVVVDSRTRYGYDVLNTRRPVKMLLKVGAGRSTLDSWNGIHWHIRLGNVVSYRALDKERQQIPWIEARRADGTTVVYEDRERKLDPADLERLSVHRMDCLDCHSRPAHQFLTPDEAVDRAIDAGRIDRALPFIKKVAVAALSRQDLSTEAGLRGIRDDVEAFYRDNFAGKVLERRQAIDGAIEAIQDLHRRHRFPEMKLDGFTHADHIGHREFPGCFRCHSGRHASSDGKLLDSSCDLCHAFVESPPSDPTAFAFIAADASTFHPWKKPEPHAIECWRCHTGKASPYSECKSCHLQALDGHAMSFECSICHKPDRPSIASANCMPCHPTPSSPLHALAGHADCLGCHRPHGWKVEAKTACTGACHATLKPDHYPDQPCVPCHDFGGVASTMMGLPAPLKAEASGL